MVEGGDCFAVEGLLVVVRQPEQDVAAACLVLSEASGLHRRIIILLPLELQQILISKSVYSKKYEFSKN